MMRFLLDTSIVADMVRHPHGRVAQRIAEVGETLVCTSIVVAAELRCGAVRKGAERLSVQLETVLRAIDVLPLEPPVDAVYGALRARLEEIGQTIGANDLFVAAHALALRCTLVTDNEREFSRIKALPVENWLR
ncbi:MAG: type II toxin-antitoxin system VapC family toxin [Bradyrhizobiaceae bacterium]|nr:type II toxin-antitoxin system VapC family toxin [Bradyrhizobiaceae bacterium]